jgi:hypothetical protein
VRFASEFFASFGVFSGNLVFKVSFDGSYLPDIAFPPQILVRWLSGRKRRFAKALYLKRVPRVRIPPSPIYLSAFPLDSRDLREGTLLYRRRSLANLSEP